MCLQTVKSPGNLVVSAYVCCADITATVTPDLKLPGSGLLLHVPLAKGHARLGGSALAQAYGQVSPQLATMQLRTRHAAVSCAELWRITSWCSAMENLRQLCCRCACAFHGTLSLCIVSCCAQNLRRTVVPVLLSGARELMHASIVRVPRWETSRQTWSRLRCGGPGRLRSTCCSSAGSRLGTTSAMAAWPLPCLRWPLLATVGFRCAWSRQQVQGQHNQ